MKAAPVQLVNKRKQITDWVHVIYFFIVIFLMSNIWHCSLSILVKINIKGVFLESLYSFEFDGQ